jgi:hypothetical protein
MRNLASGHQKDSAVAVKLTLENAWALTSTLFLHNALSKGYP